MTSGSETHSGFNAASRTVPWLIFLAFFAAWTIFHAATAPDRASTDVFIFRDAGCNCAAGQGLVADSVPHGQTAEPQLFASYTPGAPLLFSIAARAFGCKPYVDTFYTLFFASLAAGLVLYGFLRGVAATSARIWSAILVGAALPTGLISTDFDRPEAPAFCLLAILLLLWNRQRTPAFKIALVGLNGIVFLIHPYAGVVGWMLFCFLLLFASRQLETQMKRALIATTGLVLMFAIIGACALVMYRLDATSLHRFVVHATTLKAPIQQSLHGLQNEEEARAGLSAEHQTGSVAAARVGYAASLSRFFSSASPLGSLGILSLAAVCAAVAICLTLGRSSGRERLQSWAQFVMLALILVGFPLVFFPAQGNYFDLSRILFLLTIVLGEFELSDMLRRSRTPLILIAIGVLFLLPKLAVATIENVETEVSYKRASDQALRTADYFRQQGKPNPAILTDAAHFFLYKPYFQKLYALDYLAYPGARSNYDGLVLCYSGTRAFSREELAWPEGLSKTGWRLIDDGQENVRIHLFGKPVMRRNWSWSCDVYASTADEAR